MRGKMQFEFTPYCTRKQLHLKLKCFDFQNGRAAFLMTGGKLTHAVLDDF